MKKQVPAPIFTLRGHKSPVTALTFFKNGEQGNHLISGSSCGTLKLWNLSTFRCIQTIEASPHSSILWAGCSKYQADTLYTQGKNDAVYAWNLENNFNSPIKVTQLEGEGFCQCEVIGGGSSDLLAFAGKEKSSIHIFDTSSSSVTHKLKPDHSYGMTMCLRSVHDSNNVSVICGYEDGTIALWDLRKMKMLSSVSLYKDPIMCIDARHISSEVRGVAGSANCLLSNWESDRNVLKDRKIEMRFKGVSCSQIRCDNKILCITSWDGTISIYSWKTFKLLAILDHHSEIVHCARFSDLPIGNYGYLLAAGSKDTHISLWSIYP